MKNVRISVTEAARSFADCVDRCHDENTNFVLLKHGIPIAQLVPIAERVCTGKQLAAAVAATKLTDDELRKWRSEFVDARESLLPPSADRSADS